MNGYKVVYLPAALRQMEDAVAYIAADLNAPEAALAMANEMDEAAQKLKELPHRFPIYPAMYAMKQEIRYFPVKNDLVFYVVREEGRTVEIWRVLHRLQRRERG